MNYIFSKFKTKLVFFFVSLFVLVQIITNTVVYLTTTSNLESQALSNLNFSSETFNRAVIQQSDELEDAVTILSRDFGFREAVATEDNPTIVSALKNLANRINADKAFLLSLDQNVLAHYSEGDDLLEDSDGLFHDTHVENFPVEELFKEVSKEGKAIGHTLIEDKIYEVVMLPVLAPVPIGWVVLGVEVDASYLESIKQILPVGLEISIVHNFVVDQNILSATTFSGPDLNKNSIINNISAIEENSVIQQNIMNQRYMSKFISLKSTMSNLNIYAVIHYSLDVVFSPFKPLIITLISLLVIGMVAFTYESFVIAQSVTKPLRKLTEAASKISSGIYEPLKGIVQKDEFGELATSFNKMIEDIDVRERKITFQAEHDLETGLPNRSKFESILSNLIDENSLISNNDDKIDVFIVTVQAMDDVRNTLGYTTGEKLMVQIGEHLNDVVPKAEIIARLDTVSFIFALKEQNEKRNTTINSVLNSFSRPFHCDDYNIDVNVQIGVATYPDHAQTVDHLIQKTNVAVSQSMGSAHHFSVYNAEKDTQDTQKLSLMGDLRESMNKGEVFFNYQPKIDLKTGRMTHVEALIRWIHPERGFVPPDDFIFLAEQTGHIHALTEWALEAAIDASSRWNKLGYPIKVAVNLSAKDLVNRSLPANIKQLMTTKNVSAGNMVFEVTESAVMQDPEVVLDILNKMSDMGLTISIDDYGTGYSSMSYLKELPVNELKIDKSFVLNLATNKNDQILVRSTIELAHNLGLKVTAEGIEDAESAELLKLYDCDVAQGYYFSRPLSEKDLLKFAMESEYGLLQKTA